MNNGPTDAVSISVNTLFGVEQRKGMVQVQVGKTGIIMAADDAREFGMLLLTCADIAEQETVLYRVLTRMGMTQQEFAKLLAQLRDESLIEPAPAPAPMPIPAPTTKTKTRLLQ